MADFFTSLLLLISGLFSGFLSTTLSVVNPPLVATHDEEVSILFAGDMIFDRSIRVAGEDKGGDFLFSCIAPVLDDADLVVANLEGPITTHESMSVGSVIGTPENFTFTFPTSTATLLKKYNISLVNLGNNHMLNFSREGLVQTKEWLTHAGVAYFGDPDSPEELRVDRREINGIPFAFVNWSDWTSDKTDHTVAQVRREVEAGRVTVVYTHWGEEYVEPTRQMRQLAHSFIDAGAAIVIGSHPHVIQEHETYKGKEIYYSLGNFIFDQYWNAEVRTGLLVKVIFDKNGVQSVKEMKTWLERDRRTCLLTDQS